ncbi:hypothetical protein M426DRAFT_235188 [Hypoxylon sp. CI-4A]|nr:hypothetical protein M426DRAFT_235188 [Hypoxylon sp. CI-4A]
MDRHEATRHMDLDETDGGLSYFIHQGRVQLPQGISQGRQSIPPMPASQPYQINHNDNTSITITNLPPTCSYPQLLNSIRRCGRIFSTRIEPPSSTTLPNTSSAEIVFFNRVAARSLLHQAQIGAFRVDNYLPTVSYSYSRTRDRQPGPQSRVLLIEGPKLIVNFNLLATLFCSYFLCKLQDVLVIADDGQLTKQEWRFSSYRYQSEAALRSILREKARTDLPEYIQFAWDAVRVSFGVDPCAT